MAPPSPTLWRVEDLRLSFGKRVRDLRKGLGLSQEALAERAHLHWTYVSGVERGMRSPGLDVIGRLASALRVSPSDLFLPLRGRYRLSRRQRPGGD